MPIYRSARPAPAFWNVIKTVPAIALFSFVLLQIVPKLIVRAQISGEFDVLVFPAQREIGLFLSWAGAAVVLWSALMLAIKGGGTPFPFDAPRRLVVDGPYAWFRNPMVTGMVAQGIGIGIAVGSGLVMLFFAFLALLWELLVRREDEDELQRTFGREFELYRRSVRCWLPMRAPLDSAAADRADIARRSARPAGSKAAFEPCRHCPLGLTDAAPARASASGIPIQHVASGRASPAGASRDPSPPTEPEMPEVNYLAVLVAAVAAFILGAIWYSPALFVKPWMVEIRFNPESLQGAKPPMARLCSPWPSSPRS